MQILNNTQILQKIERIAFEIFERNHEESELFLLGVNNNGYLLAQLLFESLSQIPEMKMKLTLSRVRVNAANPIDHECFLEGCSVNDLKNKRIILIDDVANTGRTLFYCFSPLMTILPDKIEVAVMVDRKHKLFPVHVDYVGMSLATTLKEHIRVHLQGEDKFAKLV